MAAGLLGLLALGPLAPRQAPGALSAVQVASGLQQPLFAASPPGDSRLFIVERAGRIRILENGAILPTPFLDLTAQVSTACEGGLLGIAFPPDFQTSARVYVYYVAQAVSPSQAWVVARYTLASPGSNVAPPGSQEVILRLDQPLCGHNGGTLAFGPKDGMLYLAFGDGDGATGNDPGNRAQDLGERAGKMLRIDVSGGPSPPYAVPSDNPFTAAPDAGDGTCNGECDEIWALGLRNPYRFSFDRLTGDLWIADVGQDLVEEVDFQEAYDPSDPGQQPGGPAYPGGRNYGWRIMEGDQCNIADPPPAPPCGDPSLVLPIHQYLHTPPGCSGSITGGYVYRGSSAPEVQGHYFFADWCRGKIWSLEPSTGLVTDRSAELGAAAVPFQLVGFAEDGAAELYVVLAGGAIYRIQGASRSVPRASLTVRDKDGQPSSRRLLARSTDEGLAAPPPGSASDPTLAGGVLRLANPTTGENVVLPLPTAHWRGLGNPPGSRGYLYLDKSLVDGPCRVVLVKPGRVMRAVCKGGGAFELGFTLDEPSQGGLTVSLELGAAPGYCISFDAVSGTILKDTAAVDGRSGSFRAAGALAAYGCSAP